MLKNIDAMNRLHAKLILQLFTVFILNEDLDQTMNRIDLYCKNMYLCIQIINLFVVKFMPNHNS